MLPLAPGPREERITADWCRSWLLDDDRVHCTEENGSPSSEQERGNAAQMVRVDADPASHRIVTVGTHHDSTPFLSGSPMIGLIDSPGSTSSIPARQIMS